MPASDEPNLPALEHVGWMSDSGLFYNEAQKDENPHVPLYPVYRLKEQP